MFKKILIANRGEIAVRVIRACHELDIKAAAIFSEPDRHARHVRLADEAWILEGQPGKVYLDCDQIIALAGKSGAEAIHPGYGFLAENPEFAEAIAAAGLVFIGPGADVIRQMGSKVESRRLMKAAGVPVVPGTVDPVSDLEKAKALAAQFGYPVAIKASAGGGGRGLRVVGKEAELEQALAGAAREGQSYFGNGEVYLEKYLDQPRHIEVQILADSFGNVVHLGERDCSSQRRHQKLLEETPAPNLSEQLRARILSHAVLAAKSIGYRSAGTVEGLVAGDDYYFLEMNTRVQVEHPITEAVTGIDIVKEQIRIAAGRPLSFAQSDVVSRGHAIECRINAEDPYKNFLPSPGKVTKYAEPSRPWVRVDSACYEGYEVLPLYDSLLAKLVVWGRDRNEAIARTKLALKEFVIKGPATTIPAHLALLGDETFIAGKVSTFYVEKELKPRLKPPVHEGLPGSGSNGHPVESVKLTRSAPRNFEIEVGQRHFKVQVAEVVEADVKATATQSTAKAAMPARAATTRSNTPAAPAAAIGEICASMHSLVKQVLVAEGEAVKRGQRLMVLEAMKMESDIVSDADGLIKSLKVKAGDTVEANQHLLSVEPAK